jgi:hypothetical protein
MQLKINDHDKIIEWIPYNQFIDIKKIEKDDENTDITYLAIWKNGPLTKYEYSIKYMLKRKHYKKVTLKCLNNSYNKLNKFLNEV